MLVLVLTASIEQASYTVMEAVGELEVCLVLNCQAFETVTVTVLAREGNPVEARGESDLS